MPFSWFHEDAEVRDITYSSRI